MPTAPYGSWPSPSQQQWPPPRACATPSPGSATDGSAWWLERRPSDEGRTTLVRDGEDVTPPETERAHARARVRRRRLVPPRRHRLLLRTTPTSASIASTPARAPRPITPEPPRPRRCATPTAAPPRRRADRLRARDPRRDGEPVNDLVALPGRRRRRAAGARLRPRLLRLPAAQPRRHPGWPGPAGTTPTCRGTAPSCGWRRSTRPTQARLVAGGRSESIWQPDWSPDGALHYVSDRTAGGTSTARASS